MPRGHPLPLAQLLLIREKGGTGGKEIEMDDVKRDKYQEIADGLIRRGKYPANPGGSRSLRGSEGELIILHEEDGIIVFNFVEKGEVRLVQIDEKPSPSEAGALPSSEEAPYEPEPIWVEQLGYDGSIEKVDFRDFSVPIACANPNCNNIRYVKPNNLHAVTKCKPCTRRDRRRRRRQVLKERGYRSAWFTKKLQEQEEKRKRKEGEQ